MKTLQITLFAILAVCFASCSGNNKAQDLADKITSKSQEVLDVLDGVTDIESAKAASKKLDSLATELIALDNEIKTIKITHDKKEKLDAEMEENGRNFEKSIKEKLAKITKDSPEAAMVVIKGLDSFFSKISKSK